MKSTGDGPRSTQDPCPDCGGRLGGRPGCEAAWFALGVRARQEPDVVWTRAMHDAWCLQHPEPYTRSLKSFYVHFLGLCVAMDRPSDPRAQSAIWEDIRVPDDIQRPSAPNPRPLMSAADVVRSPTHQIGERFVASEWDRWAHAHSVAREWLARELRMRRRGGSHEEGARRRSG